MKKSMNLSFVSCTCPFVSAPQRTEIARLQSAILKRITHNAMVLCLLCGASRISLADATSETFRNVTEKRNQITSIACDVTEEKKDHFNRETVQRSEGRLLARAPNFFRRELVDQSGTREFLIAEPGRNCSTHFLKDVRCELESTYDADSPISPFKTQPDFEEGTSNWEDKRLLVFSYGRGNPRRLWIDPQTGITIREREYYKTLPDDPESIADLMRGWEYRNCKRNPQIPASEFRFVPLPGAKVTTRRRVGRGYDTSVEETPLLVPSNEQRAIAQEKIAALQARFEKQKYFSGTYRDSIEADHGTMRNGKAERVLVNRKGFLYVSTDDRYSMYYEEVLKPDAFIKQKITAFNGTSLWSSDGPATHKDKKLVHLYPNGAPSRFGFFGGLIMSVRGSPGPRVEELVEGREAFEVPQWIRRPFGGMAPADAVFEGTEDIDGGSVLKFMIPESTKQRKSFHWIGESDGIVRRVSVWDWASAKEQGTFELSDVTVLASEPQLTFVNDGTWVEVNARGVETGAEKLQNPPTAQSIQLPAEVLWLLNDADKNLINHFVVGDVRWSVQNMPPSKKPISRLAHRLSDPTYVWNGKQIASPPDYLSGSWSPSLSVALGLDGPINDSQYWPKVPPAPTINVGESSEPRTVTVPVLEDSNRRFFSSRAVLRGKHFSISITEGSEQAQRLLTQAILDGWAAEIRPLKDSSGSKLPEDLSSGIVQLIDGPIVLKTLEPQRYKPLLGHANFAVPGYLCHVVKGPRRNRSIEECPGEGRDHVYVGWSDNRNEGFPFSMPLEVPGPGDGENYPYVHEHELWFVSSDGTTSLKLFEGRSVQGHLTLVPFSKR